MNEATWVSAPTAQRLLGDISRMELYRRTKLGDSNFIITRPREDGKPGLLYAVPCICMDFEAQKRFQQEQLRAALAPLSALRINPEPNFDFCENQTYSEIALYDLC